MKIIALGSPGVGKGTYAAELVKKYDLIHISSGDLFRENIKNQTPLGIIAKKHIDQGHLVPDEVTIGMVKEKLAQLDGKSGEKSYLLDGFPRTIPQAEALSTFSEVDLVINFKADHKVIIQRLSGRRICRKCGAIFHVQNLPPKIKGICDKCGGEIYQRDDDQPEAIKERLMVYEKQTKPLIEYYHQKGWLREVTVNEDFSTHKEQIMNRIYAVIERKSFD